MYRVSDLIISRLSFHFQSDIYSDSVECFVFIQSELEWFCIVRVGYEEDAN